MHDNVKWHIEAIRIGITVISVIVTIVLFGTRLDKGIALNQQRLDIIEDNHLTHIQASVESMEEDVVCLREDIAEIKALLTK